MRASRSSLLLLVAFLLTLQGEAQAPATRVTYLPYSEAQPLLQSLDDVLPAELKNVPAGQRAAAWPNYARKHDREIRRRLGRGEEDSLVNLLFFGTSFTRQRRLTEDDVARLGGAQPSKTDPLIQARAADLLRALVRSGGNEQMARARQVLSQRGYDLATPSGRQRTHQFLLASVARVLGERAGFAAALADAQQGSATDEFAQRSRLYRDRGLSLDAGLRPNFAIEQSLAELKQRGLLAPGSVKRVAVVGPGLEFLSTWGGHDLYPEQTIQPFAVMDSLLRLGLTDAKALTVTTLDLSPRMNAHLRRAGERAAAGAGYTVQLLRATDARWGPEFVAYWQQFGDQIGVKAKPAALPQDAKLAIRAVRIRPQMVRRVRASDLNVVLQRISRAGYDLIVATNVFVYYDLFEQCLALQNVGQMLRPGGFLLSNNALLELPSSQVHSVGYLTTVYSDRPDDRDHIVWYQRDPEK